MTETREIKNGTQPPPTRKLLLSFDVNSNNIFNKKNLIAVCIKIKKGSYLDFLVLSFAEKNKIKIKLVDV